MNVFNSPTVCVEIFKTLSNLNRSFMSDAFQTSFMSDAFQTRLTNSPPRGKYILNLEILKIKHVKFGKKFVWRMFAPKI